MKYGTLFNTLKQNDPILWHSQVKTECYSDPVIPIWLHTANMKAILLGFPAENFLS